MKDPDDQTIDLMTVVDAVEAFDRRMEQALPYLLDRAALHTRRFLKDTGQWADDVGHEKLALRWGYELVERFLVAGRMEVPCRPLPLLDSLIAKFLSRPEPFCYHHELGTLLGRWIEGMTARAVISRDALMALFHHLYGWSQGQVVRLLAFDSVEAQRIYKNFDRWRRTGWERAMTEIGITEDELSELEEAKGRGPDTFHAEAERLIPLAQAHYRKSEPDHYRCLTGDQWRDLFEQNYGHDYRVWHLALCYECVGKVSAVRGLTMPGAALRVDLQLRPLARAPFAVVMGERGGRTHGPARSAAQRISSVSH